jgi:hypothetical protein
MNKSFQTIFKIISRWQNVLVIFGIIAVAVLHAVIQTYFIQSETEKNLIVEEVSVKAGKIVLPQTEKAEPIAQQSVETEPKEFEPKKIHKIVETKSTPQIKQRRDEIAQPKPKKKEAVETRSERLRRAERILTGI